MTPVAPGTLHHVELWVPDLRRATEEWGWLLGELGYAPLQEWTAGRSWRHGDTYIVVERSPAMTVPEHDRHRGGLNHLAFHAGGRHDVDALAAAGPSHGWSLMFGDAHPHAGGPDHYAAYLSNTDGYEVELVADEFSLAAMTGVDLQREIEAKIAKNASRVYRPLPNGTLVKDSAKADQ